VTSTARAVAANVAERSFAAVSASDSAGGPAVLGTKDLPKIVASSKLFARKFDVMQDEQILDMIDQETIDR
jgi:hypothetical protein